jgi:hypothetical protein
VEGRCWLTRLLAFKVIYARAPSATIETKHVMRQPLFQLYASSNIYAFLKTFLDNKKCFD